MKEEKYTYKNITEHTELTIKNPKSFEDAKRMEKLIEQVKP